MANQSSSSDKHHLHVVFFPYPAHGHMIPMLDTAKLFSSKNLRTTIVTTPLNKSLVSLGVEQWSQKGGTDRIIKSETVTMAVDRMMEDEEMRRKAQDLGELAKKAVEEGGSSHSDLDALIDELHKIRN
ncbi:UDP-glycosyltransferase 73B4 [Euphorbia peplus]|nr:UDP-glycosyltransferase 73B4 [Euphorbia peplus]